VRVNQEQASGSRTDEQGDENGRDAASQRRGARLGPFLGRWSRSG
jgi:hypothetical protein